MSLNFVLYNSVNNLATNMLKKGKQGKNTGMGQSTKTQEERYDDQQQAAGLRNKVKEVMANEELLQAPWFLIRYSHWGMSK